MTMHAAGIVISPTEMNEYTPVQFDTKGEGKIVTQYDMYSVEDAGLLKFDFLGLKNLSIINDVFKLIKKHKNIDIDLDTIPIDDKKTFDMLARGETTDVFQLNGAGMTKYLMQLQPSNIHDINAMVALYRPGPLGFIPEFIARKHNPNLIKYLDPALEPILKKTYGILVYQDDLLLMGVNLAGYTWGEVDKFRKAVGKKILEEMAKQKIKFIEGLQKHSGWSEDKAKQVWAWIEPFASYGFNKAHSVSYGRVAYQTAYLKANFPAEYMTAILIHEQGKLEDVNISVNECKRLGIQVLPPDINECFRDFYLAYEDGEPAIYFGLSSIKMFGEGVADDIIAEREKNGKFKSLEDFLTRIQGSAFNKKSLEALIKCGALDAFGERGEMFGNIQHLLDFNKEISKNSADQDSLFSSDGIDLPPLKLTKMRSASFEEKLMWEKELLGLYVSGHPIDRYQDALANRGATLKQIRASGKADLTVVASGLVEEFREITTKKGDKMAFVKINDLEDSLELVLFPKSYEQFKDLIVVDTCISVKGKMQKKNFQSEEGVDDYSILVDAVKTLPKNALKKV
jgi:DNA polymerase-3 subunit alpha